MFDQLMALQWVKDNIEQFGGENSHCHSPNLISTILELREIE